MGYSKTKVLDEEKCVMCLCNSGKLRKDGVDITDKLLMLPGGKQMVERMLQKYKGEEAVKHFRDKLRERKNA